MCRKIGVCKRTKWDLIPPLFWILLWLLFHNIEINLKSSKKCQNSFVDNAAKLSSRIVRDHWPQLTPFQNILEMDLPIAIFSEKSANYIILHLYHHYKVKRHMLSKFGTHRMLISWFAHHNWDQYCSNEHLHFAIEERMLVGHWSQRKEIAF